jgi:predicted nucleic acid-binding protein
MNSQFILLDTNTLLNFLNGEELEVNLVDDKKILISEITEMEIQCQPNLRYAERKLLKEFISGLSVIRLSDEIKDLAVKIRLSTRMKLMDSIIAATAQVLNFPLITCDEKFDSVKTATIILLPSLDKR